ncbi:PepSY domain-containing protein [Streptomyces sp. SBC-4]|nr:PepSY domain-containing protein [Streptomyces sp. SBC-4]MDV5149972.1 PepSY domain-containing protein [Streptomyces sp. SBC-4]
MRSAEWGHRIGRRKEPHEAQTRDRHRHRGRPGHRGTAVALAAGGTESAPVQQARAVLDLDDDDRGREAAREARITAVQAIDTAVKARPGTVVSAELDDDADESDDGWEVVVLDAKGSTTHTVHIDPVSGRVLGTDTDTDDSNDD